MLKGATFRNFNSNNALRQALDVAQQQSGRNVIFTASSMKNTSIRRSLTSSAAQICTIQGPSLHRNIGHGRFLALSKTLLGDYQRSAMQRTAFSRAQRRFLSHSILAASSNPPHKPGKSHSIPQSGYDPVLESAYTFKDAHHPSSTHFSHTQSLRTRFDRSNTRKQLLSLQAELQSLRSRLPKPSRLSSALYSLLLLVTATLLTYHYSHDFRRLVLAGERCALVGYAVALCIIDYKILFRRTWDESTEDGVKRRHDDYESCHSRCAVRIREVLKKNGGIYIKLGQHLSSIQLIPTAWSQAMLPLQDQCLPSSMTSIQSLFLSDVGAPLSILFSEFDENPIGVASLAQVHMAIDRETGKKVAVKIMHPDLEEFCQVDMKTTTFMLKVVKSIFPSFEFTWLGEEMEQNLPLEMDFRHEAANAARCRSDFADLAKTTLVIPEVLWAKKRAMAMEYIDGKRIDDLAYLAEKNIDRNRVATELAHIFCRMIYLTGWVHGDAHLGNLLIRPTPPGSRSPHNFEIVLLDHGFYFDISEELRTNYAHLWLSLLSPSTPSVEKDRRKYAALAGNIDDELYPIFQAAITGRAALEGSWAEGTSDPAADIQNRRGLKGGKKAPKSMMELGAQTHEEMHEMRQKVVMQEGLMLSLFDLLRRVPRRILMVLKVNDLTRALDASLHTTHGPTRVFLIVAQYCAKAVYKSAPTYFESPLIFLSCWLSYTRWRLGLGAAERWLDTKAKVEKGRLWLRGWRKEGWRKAWEAQAGLLKVDA